MLHVRIRAGGRPQGRSLPQLFSGGIAVGGFEDTDRSWPFGQFLCRPSEPPSSGAIFPKPRFAPERAGVAAKSQPGNRRAVGTTAEPVARL